MSTNGSGSSHFPVEGDERRSCAIRSGAFGLGQPTENRAQWSPPPLQSAAAQPSQNHFAASSEVPVQRPDLAVLLQMMQFMQQQQQQMQEQMQLQHQIFTHLLQQKQSASQTAQRSQPKSSAPINPERMLDAVPGKITEFRCEAESDEDLFLQEASRLDDAAKVFQLTKSLNEDLGSGQPREGSLRQGVHRETRDQSTGPCCLCGDSHWPRECSYTLRKCRCFNRTGNREGNCIKQSDRRQEQTSKKWTKRTPIEKRMVALNVRKVTKVRKLVDLLIGNKKVRMQLDTGLDVTVVGRTTWEQLAKPTLKPVGVDARTASGFRPQADGVIAAKVTMRDRTEVMVPRVLPSDLQRRVTDLTGQLQLGSAPEEDKRFRSGDTVYAKLYARNSWRWVPARIVRALGPSVQSVTALHSPSHTGEPNLSPLDLLIDTASQETRPISPEEQQVDTPDPVASPRPVPFAKSGRRQPIQMPRWSSRRGRPPRRLEKYRLN